MKNIKRKIHEYLKRFQFTQGMALGLTISSFLAYGVVNITSFSPGTTISSVDVNNNFQQLRAAVEALQSKQVGSIAAPYDVNCVSSPTGVQFPSYPTDYVDVPFDIEDGSTGTITPDQSTITVSDAGLYQIIYSLPEVVSGPSMHKYININGSSLIVGTDGVITKKLNGSETIKVEAGCLNYGGTPKATLAQDAVIVIKKL